MTSRLRRLQSGRGRVGARGGFTLIEILIAVALVGLLLVALNTFVFSMSELWGRGGEGRLFDQHVRAVSRFLESELRTAGLPPTVSSGTAAATAEEIRTQSGLSETLLQFELREGSRLIVWPNNRPLPDVVCGLAVRSGRGLFLLWHSRLETRFADDPPRETLISPFVSAISYEYYDTSFKRYQSESSPKRVTSGDGYEPPQRIKLTFKRGTMTKESYISLPVAAEGLPML